MFNIKLAMIYNYLNYEVKKTNLRYLNKAALVGKKFIEASS